jgi:hypothetical protein
MEFLLVTFPHERDVLIDGVAAGLTNHLITLGGGVFLVSLAPPADFLPSEVEVAVHDTSPLEPVEVVFAAR